MSRSDASDAPTTSAMRLEPKRHLVAGTVAGGMATATLYPLDLVKTRLQVQQERRGIVSAMRNIVQREGVRGLYQGLGPALLGNTVTWGGYFFFYEAAKQRNAMAEWIKMETTTLRPSRAPSTRAELRPRPPPARRSARRSRL